jgi:glycerate kinase
MSAGVAAVWPHAERVECPLSDGGNGLLDSYAVLRGGAVVESTVGGPLGVPTLARFLLDDRTAVVESAEACGLHLVPPDGLDPLHATSRGLGELLLVARTAGASKLVLGLGGSATVDGGTGMARALGWGFMDPQGGRLPEGGGALDTLGRIEAPTSPFAVEVVALCDVANPLTGPQGAARVYGPQKGARPADVARLEAGLERLAAVIHADLGLAAAELPGAGAAGGLGAGARAFLGAELVAGAEWMMELAGFRGLLQRADLIVTGEGRYDAQSGMGKVSGRVLEAARSAGIPVLLVAGRVEGPLPEGVAAVTGGAAPLKVADVTRLVEDACRSLASGGRL